MSVPDERSTLLDASGIDRTLQQMADEVVRFAGECDLVLVGIQRRGVDLANRLAGMIGPKLGRPIPQGKLDITLYRDDLRTVGPRPVIGQTDIPMDLTEKCVMIVDDVLFTGRTIRAALAEISDFGRPARVGLCVLVDRGGRELPIQADVVGERVAAAHRDRVDVLLREVDGRDAVELVRGLAA